MKYENIVFLCTANSARSILAESIFKHLCADKFSVYSAGSRSSGIVNGFAIDFLNSKGVCSKDAKSKTLEQLPIKLSEEDLVVAVCGGAIDEVCPLPEFNAQVLRLILPDPVVPNEQEKSSISHFSIVGNYLMEELPKLIDMLNAEEPLERMNDYFKSSNKLKLVEECNV